MTVSSVPTKPGEPPKCRLRNRRHASLCHFRGFQDVSAVRACFDLGHPISNLFRPVPSSVGFLSDVADWAWIVGAPMSQTQSWLRHWSDRDHRPLVDWCAAECADTFVQTGLLGHGLQAPASSPSQGRPRMSSQSCNQFLFCPVDCRMLHARSSFRSGVSDLSDGVMCPAFVSKTAPDGCRHQCCTPSMLLMLCACRLRPGFANRTLAKGTQHFFGPSESTERFVVGVW